MRHSPWALALLALSLPAPTLADPLHRLGIGDAVWNRSFDHDSSAFSGSDRPWRRYRPEFEEEEAFDATPPLRWRGRSVYAPGGGQQDDEGDDLGYRYGYGGDRFRPLPTPGMGSGYRPGRRTPLAVIPAAPQPLRRCGPAPALVGAAIGGGLGAALSDGSRQRQWALPIGATVGGLLGGMLAGC